MYTVHVWVDDHGTELLGYFEDQYVAYEFMVSYAHLHCISLDELVLGHLEKDKIISMFKEFR